MLKGQLDLDIEFMGGTIIFIMGGLLMFTQLLFPLLAVSYNSATTGDDVRAIEVANMVGMKMTDNFGDGYIVYNNIIADLAGVANVVGISDSYIRIESIVSDGYFEFGSGKDGTSHDVYSSISKHYVMPEGRGDVIMNGGKSYIIHVYSVDSNTVIDIYDSHYCEKGGPAQDLPEAYLKLSCEEMEMLEAEEKDSDAIKNEMVSPVRNGASSSVTGLIKPPEDVHVSDVAVMGMKFSTEDCLEPGEGNLCIRMMGEYVLPVRIHIEIEDDAEFKETGFITSDGGKVGGTW